MADKDPYVSRDTQILDNGGFVARRGREFSYQTPEGATHTVWERLPYTPQEIDLWKAQDTTTKPDGSTSTIHRDYTSGRFDPNWVDQRFLDTVARYSGGSTATASKPAATTTSKAIDQPAGDGKPTAPWQGSTAAPRQLMTGGATTGAEPPPPLQAPQRSLMPVADQQLQRAPFQAPTQQMPSPYTTQVGEQETVFGQLKQLLDADSPYLEQGRQAGLTAMSQRGLQNSSFAAQAGEQARIAAALPIAQADASTYAQRAQLNQNTINQFRMNQMDHLQNMIEMAQQGNINAQLQLDQYTFSSSLSAQENVQRLEQMAFAGDIEARQRYLDFGYSTIMAGIQHGYALELNDQQFQNSQTLLMQEFANAQQLSSQQSEQRINELNASHQNTLDEIARRSELATTEAGINLGYALQQQYLGQVAARQQAASEEIRLIMQTEGLSAAQQNAAVAAAQRRMEADIKALQAYYAKSPQWNDDFVGVTPPPTSGGIIPADETGGTAVLGDGTINRREQIYDYFNQGGGRRVLML